MKMCPGGAGLVVLTNNNVFCSVSNLDQNSDSPRTWKEAAMRLAEYCMLMLILGRSLRRKMYEYLKGRSWMMEENKI